MTKTLTGQREQLILKAGLANVWLLIIEINMGTSLVAQWLRIHLPMQGTRVWALVREDPTCRGATKPVRLNYWAHMPQLPKTTDLEPVLCNKEKPPQWEARAPQRRVAALTTTRESPRAATKTQHSQKHR